MENLESVIVRPCYRNMYAKEKRRVPISELPCKPGETFFAIWGNEVHELVFKYLKENPYNNYSIQIIGTIKGKDFDMRCVELKENAYKTFEEAEAALKEKKAS